LRTPAANVEMVTLDSTPWPNAKFIPLDAAEGVLIPLDGMLPHGSAANCSNISRHAFTLHVIDGACRYLAENWLQRLLALSLTGFTSAK